MPDSDSSGTIMEQAKKNYRCEECVIYPSFIPPPPVLKRQNARELVPVNVYFCNCNKRGHILLPKPE